MCDSIERVWRCVHVRVYGGLCVYVCVCVCVSDSNNLLPFLFHKTFIILFKIMTLRQDGVMRYMKISVRSWFSMLDTISYIRE